MTYPCLHLKNHANDDGDDDDDAPLVFFVKVNKHFCKHFAIGTMSNYYKYPRYLMLDFLEQSPLEFLFLAL